MHLVVSPVVLFSPIIHQTMIETKAEPETALLFVYFFCSSGLSFISHPQTSDLPA